MRATVSAAGGLPAHRHALPWTGVGSVLASAVHAGVLAGGVELLGLDHLIANAAGALAGGLTHFLFIKRIAFRAPGGSLRRQLLRYGLVSATSLGMTTLGLALFTGVLGVPYLAAWGLGACLVAALFGYPAARSFVFSDGAGASAPGGSPAPGASARSAPLPTGWSRWLVLTLATALGAGRSRWWPGTVGTVMGMPLLVGTSFLPCWLQLVVAGTVTGAAIVIADAAGRIYGESDDQRIVIDEVAGVLVAGLMLPPGWAWWAAAFVLFRLADVCKPAPARWLDRYLHDGFGCVLDDVVAGLWVLLGLQLVAWWVA